MRRLWVKVVEEELEEDEDEDEYEYEDENIPEANAPTKRIRSLIQLNS